MKKIVAPIIAFALVIVACNKKATPAITQETAPAKTEETVKPEVTKMTKQDQEVITAKQKEETNPSVIPVSAEVAGKAIYDTKCARCHAAKKVDNFTMAQWEGILRSMVPKAKLNAEEEAQVVAYVKAHAKLI